MFRPIYRLFPWKIVEYSGMDESFCSTDTAKGTGRTLLIVQKALKMHSKCTQNASFPGYQCSPKISQHCANVGNPWNGMQSFDNFGSALVLIFQVKTHLKYTKNTPKMH